MNYMNRIMIQGRIGTIRIAELSSGVQANFSLVTDYIYKAVDGNAVCETTWFNVSAFQQSGKEIDLKGLKKGDVVRVVGRMRTVKYTDAAGVDKVFYEVVASDVELIEED